MDKIVFPVTGMTCNGCVASVERALAKQSGVQAAKASLERAEVNVTFDPAAITPDRLKDTVRKAGFTVAG